MTLAEQAAGAYGVLLVPDRGEHEVLPPDFAWGPFGHGCSPTDRFVLVHPTRGHELLDDPMGVFHDVTHVVVHPPFARMSEFSEDLVQLPFERALADHFMTCGAPLHQLQLLHQQTPTSEPWPYDIHASFDENDRALLDSPLWRAGVAVGRFVGLLDENGGVRLGAWPQWSRKPVAWWQWLFALSADGRLSALERAN